LYLNILWKLVELEGSWPSKMCPNSAVLVQSIAQLEGKLGVNEGTAENKSPSPIVTQPDPTQPNIGSPGSKKKKKKNKSKDSTDSKKQDAAPPTPASPSPIRTNTTKDSSNILDKLQGLNINTSNNSNNNNTSNKMSVARCGVVKILATIADIKVNGSYPTLDALANDQYAWQVMASWFMRYPYASITHLIAWLLSPLLLHSICIATRYLSPTILYTR
jgi:hypothetical protein